MRKFVLMLLLTSLGGLSAKETSEEEDSPYQEIEVLARAIQLIRQDFVDESKVGYRDLTYAALRGMLQELDPHSQFMEPEIYESMQEDTKSEFGGLGVVVSMEDGVLVIVSPMEDSPGFEAGLEPGDRILRINGKTTDRLTMAEALELLRGEAGERVTLTVQRADTREVKDFEITRQVIKVPSVKDGQIISTGDGPKVGYVRITQFNEPTASELAKALDQIEKQGAQALILDLRYNPGGLLGSAVDVCGLFVPTGTKIVSTEGRTPGREYSANAHGHTLRKYPLVVLVNYASASGSEVVAGALKDLGRAIIVGETTFGKGSVQSVVALPDGSAVRLTTAKYYTPAKSVIHEKGVSPQIRIPLTPEQELALLRWRRGGGSSVTADPALDPQLARAVDVLQGLLLHASKKEKSAGG